MLVQLTPEQITANWLTIKEPIRQALIPQMDVTDKAMNEILKNLTQGTSQAWVLSDLVNGAAVIYAVGTTCFSTEAMTGTKNLLIYSLYGYKLIPDNLWKDALETLMKFAKREGCFKIIAFTLIGRVIDIARGLGADVNIRQLSWEV